MTRETQTNGGGVPKRVANGLFSSVSALVALCAKHASRVSRKLRTNTSDSKIAPRSPLTRPKQLLMSISNKAIPFIHKKRVGEESEVEAEHGFGDGGLWQRSILMGDKCQPLAFSGVIYYDANGKQFSEVPPRSPRASPLPSYAFPTAKSEL